MISSGDMFRTLSEKEAVGGQREKNSVSVDVRGWLRAGEGSGPDMKFKKEKKKKGTYIFQER